MMSLPRLCALLSAAFLLTTAFSPSPTRAQDAPFITVWDTENSGVTDDDQIKIPGEGTDYSVEWEEVGNTSNSGSETVASGDTTLTFPSPGLYRVKISGNFTRIHFGGDSGGDSEKIELVTQWGDIEWTSMKGAFRECSNFDLDTTGNPDLSSVKNMSRMFQGAPSFNQDLEAWNIDNVSNINYIFKNASSFNGDISNWNTSNITKMRGAFDGASSFKGNISSWDTGNVEDMGFMFAGEIPFNGDISGWNTSNVTNMDYMFSNATQFNRNISIWDTSSLTSMEWFAQGADSFNQNLGFWDISNMESGGIENIFGFTSMSYTNYDRTVIGWAVQDVTGMDLPIFAPYCNSKPFRDYLTDALGWTIDDEGRRSGCPDILTASNSEEVDEDGTFIFSDVPASLVFSGVIGSGRVTIARYGDRPRNVEGISESNISEYRFIIAGGEITSFDGAEVRFPVSEYGGISQPENVTVYRRDKPSTGSFSSLETTVDENGSPDDISDDTLSATTTDGFGEFVLASNTNELPVELASFTGTATQSSARLTWKTASETNNAGFEVHRQKEEAWTEVGYVESKVQGGSATETTSYSYTAKDLPVGTHQFRLRQVDLDGSSTLVDPVTVDIQMQEAVKLTAPAPNPASSAATLSFAVKEQVETTIRLYNTLGQQVATLHKGTPQAGEQQRAQVDVSGLPSGVYFLRLQADGQTRTQRLTVVR